ncbi:GNAT family N-acetyltransferase [Roseicitreum antarcticum]|uniref:N-acetyltransferase domain-containing protein n=1 Tax=Roseicitreum antarcticum TaxID=564137 RepID=A0A1H3E673_9RHOB|nr:GNAT family protein [Roseicitreum antarcticum]SDX74117.1 hypothetical protein SAMN04488238_11823 [Roseicitreum antarcticum]
MRVTMQNQADLIAWAEPRMGVEKDMMPSETVALGVMNDAGGIEAVICFNAFYSTYASLHVASNGGRRWLSRKVLALVFGYAFTHLNLTRLNFLVPHHNIPVQVLALKVGLRIEGVARCGANDGSDGVLFGMLASECPWLPKRVKESKNG